MNKTEYSIFEPITVNFTYTYSEAEQPSEEYYNYAFSLTPNESGIVYISTNHTGNPASPAEPYNRWELFTFIPYNYNLNLTDGNNTYYILLIFHGLLDGYVEYTRIADYKEILIFKEPTEINIRLLNNTILTYGDPIVTEINYHSIRDYNNASRTSNITVTLIYNNSVIYNESSVLNSTGTIQVHIRYGIYMTWGNFILKVVIIGNKYYSPAVNEKRFFICKGRVTFILNKIEPFPIYYKKNALLPIKINLYINVLLSNNIFYDSEIPENTIINTTYKIIDEKNGSIIFKVSLPNKPARHFLEIRYIGQKFLASPYIINLTINKHIISIIDVNYTVFENDNNKLITVNFKIKDIITTETIRIEPSYINIYIEEPEGLKPLKFNLIIKTQQYIINIPLDQINQFTKQYSKIKILIEIKESDYYEKYMYNNITLEIPSKPSILTGNMTNIIISLLSATSAAVGIYFYKTKKKYPLNSINI